MSDLRYWISLCESGAAIERELQAIIQQAADIGVALDANYENGSIAIIDIERTTEQKGSGAAVLKKLCDFADANQIDMSLMVAGGNTRLVDLYRSFGFDFDEYEESDDWIDDEDSIGYEPVMYRMPRYTN